MISDASKLKSAVDAARGISFMMSLPIVFSLQISPELSQNPSMNGASMCKLTEMYTIHRNDTMSDSYNEAYTNKKTSILFRLGA